MLTPEDRRAIEGLFDRLEDVERNGPPRDEEAEALIADKVAGQPGAPYYLAQTVLVQEAALKMAEERIEDLERRASQRRQSGGFLGGLFGDNGGDYEERRPVNSRQTQTRGPWQQQDDGYGYSRGGGGFLAGAAQTALGVTDGILLGSAIASMFGAGSANAAEGGQDQGSDQNSDQNADQGGDDAGSDGGDFGGGDFGDGGGFDMGGDF